VTNLKINTMKIKTFTAMLAVLTANLVQATLYTGGSPSATGALPDGNPVGFVSTITVNTGGDNNNINGVSVTLNLSGGYNGDLYGYLVNPNGNLAVLLNRVGTGSGGAIQTLFGYDGAGMNVNLSDAGMPGISLLGDIHTYGGGDLTGAATAWRPDNGTTDFAALHSGSAHGTWTLFLADLAPGNQSTLVSWALDVSVVPEPATWALIIFGVLAGGTVVTRQLRRA
jgi:subtilisin-like proprotein convertase family protein